MELCVSEYSVDGTDGSSCNTTLRLLFLAEHLLCIKTLQHQELMHKEGFRRTVIEQRASQNVLKQAGKFLFCWFCVALDNPNVTYYIGN